MVPPVGLLRRKQECIKDIFSLNKYTPFSEIKRLKLPLLHGLVEYSIVNSEHVVNPEQTAVNDLLTVVNLQKEVRSI